MNCNYHPTKPAVIQCRQCGKGFCEDCARDVVDGLCSSCRKTKSKAALKNVQKWHWIGLLWLLGGLVLIILAPTIAPNNHESIGMGVGICFFVFLFRYARIIAYSLLDILSPPGWGCLVSVIIPFIIELLLLFPLMCASPFLLIYSIARILGLKKGISDLFSWFKIRPII